MMRKLRHDQSGSMAIEFAFIAPVLAMLSVGGFEASSMIARQAELQSAAAEAAAIVRAAAPETSSERAVVRDVLAASTGLPTDNVTVTEVYRCGTLDNYTSQHECSSADIRTTYIKVRLMDSYTPIWSQFGIDTTLDYDVIRTVQIG